MGASGWSYRVPYAGSVKATYSALQEQVLLSGEYLWPWEYVGRTDGPPRPSSLAALGAAKDTELFWDIGTHSILDTHAVITGDKDEFGGIRPLTDAENQHLFGTERPSATDFDRVDPDGALESVLGERWSGRSVVLHRDGAPDEVYFWGCSGD